jgi:hypothetical protein
MAIGAAGQGPSTACMPTTWSSFVMAVDHSISTMVNAFVHRITNSRRWQLELEGCKAD